MWPDIDAVYTDIDDVYTDIDDVDTADCPMTTGRVCGPQRGSSVVTVVAVTVVAVVCVGLREAREAEEGHLSTSAQQTTNQWLHLIPTSTRHRGVNILLWIQRA